MSVDSDNARRSKEEVRTFLSSSPQKYVAYLSGDGRFITTWVGDVLAQVVRSSVSHRRGFYGARTTTHYVRAVDQLGRQWSGVGPGGNMYIRLKRVKGR